MADDTQGGGKGPPGGDAPEDGPRRPRDLRAEDLDQPAPDSDSLLYRWQLFEKRLDYAQTAFDHHAKQRMQVFNFFVAFAALTANAWAALLGDDKCGAATAVAFVAAVASYAFYLLDLRNEELVHIAEANLKALERDVLFVDYARPALPFWKERFRLLFRKRGKEEFQQQLGLHLIEDRNLNPAAPAERWMQHAVLIPVIQIGAAVVFLCAGVYSWIACADQAAAGAQPISVRFDEALPVEVLEVPALSIDPGPAAPADPARGADTVKRVEETLREKRARERLQESLPDTSQRLDGLATSATVAALATLLAPVVATLSETGSATTDLLTGSLQAFLDSLASKTGENLSDLGFDQLEKWLAGDEPLEVRHPQGAVVLFNHGQQLVAREADRRIRAFAEQVRRLDAPRLVLVVGYTDASGSESRNAVLSRQRAWVVARELERRGVAPAILVPIGLGVRQRASWPRTGDQEPEDRRVEMWWVARESGESG